jgi:acetylornithine deacetylase/succinyl-diaminopimelate desuccinylase-like protein
VFLSTLRRSALALLALASCSAPAPRGGADDGEEAVRLLQELIRIDTVNPPPPGSGRPDAGETELCRHVQRVLAADGIASEIYESAPGRGNLVARVRGTGAKKPVLLMAHVDVVGVERGRWSADPLSGEIRDGFVWGRGALDDKDDAAIFVQVLRILARSKERLSRDVILMLNADEESSGAFGAAWMAEKHWDRIACEFVLSEGGRAFLEGGKVVQYGFMTAEKIYNDFRLWVPGKAGHSSVPDPSNAIYSLARLLEKLESFRTPIRVTPTVAAQLEGWAELSRYAPVRDDMRRAAAGDLDAAGRLCRDPRFNAQLRSTLVPTIVKGGIRENVLPAEAEVNVNVRLLPGERIDDLVRAVAAHLGLRRFEVVEGDEAAVERWKREKKDVEAAVFLVDRGIEAPASSHETEMFRALVRTAKRLSPGAVAVPQMATGATDARFLRRKGVDCYGLAPAPTGEAEDATPHGHDERVRVESVKFGVSFVLEAVREVCR